MPPTTAPGIEPKPPRTAAVNPLMATRPIFDDRKTTGAIRTPATAPTTEERIYERQVEDLERRPADERRQHQHLALREVERARGVVDDHEADRHQRVDRPGGETADDDVDESRRGHRTTFAHIGDSQPCSRNPRISRRLKSPSPRSSSARPRPESWCPSSARKTSRSPEIPGVSMPAARPADSNSVRPNATSSVTYRCSKVRISLQRPLARSFALAPAP